jgi:LemA protein
MMSGSLLLWMILAICLFWAVGLHNRLMRSRARLHGAFGSVEMHLHEFGDLVREASTRFGNRTDPTYEKWVGDSRVDWESLNEALRVLDTTLKDARAGSQSQVVMRDVFLAMDALQRTWMQLTEVPADLAGPILPQDVQTAWESIRARVAIACNGYNEIAVAYNESLKQIPARLVVGLMGFRSTGTL